MDKPTKPTALCGRTRSARGKPFTPESLRQHEQDCEGCRGSDPGDDDDDGVFSMLDLSDESDGVYFGLRDELEEWD